MSGLIPEGKYQVRVNNIRPIVNKLLDETHVHTQYVIKIKDKIAFAYATSKEHVKADVKIGDFIYVRVKHRADKDDPLRLLQCVRFLRKAKPQLPYISIKRKAA